MEAFGAAFKRLRLRNDESLREFCQRNRFDPGNISRLERGLLPPPESDDVLEAYARALNLEPGTDEWMTLLEAAALERGRIPKYLLDDEKVLAELPLVFRTLKNRKLDTEKVATLIQLIRES